MKLENLTSNALFVRNYPQGEWHSPDGKYIDPLFGGKAECRNSVPVGQIRNMAIATVDDSLTAFEKANFESAKAQEKANLKKKNVKEFIERTQKVAHNILAENLSEKKKKIKPKKKVYTVPKDLIPKAKIQNTESPKKEEENTKKNEETKEKQKTIAKEATKTQEKQKKTVKPIKPTEKIDTKKIAKKKNEGKPYSPLKPPKIENKMTPIQEILHSYDKARNQLSK